MFYVQKSISSDVLEGEAMVSAARKPGELAMFDTDRITEARSPTGEFFGEDRLDQILRDLPDPLTPEVAVQAITKQIARFEGDGLPADDETVLTLGGFMHKSGEKAVRPAGNRNHAFIDGNKRTSAVVCETFLVLNGQMLDATDVELYPGLFSTP
jgi:hypothetical protein